MAIVIPSSCKTASYTMSSTGTQADISDPEGVMGTIKSFQDQLKELQEMASTLNALRAERADGIQRSADRIEELGRKLDALMGNVKTMENKLTFKRESITETDKELEDLTNERERLDREAEEMRNLDEEIHNVDLENEQRLLGFVQEEVLRKTAELTHLRHRLGEANQEYVKEWSEYKNELQTYEEEKTPYLETLDHLNELILARHVGMQSGKEADPSARDLTERLIAHHFDKIQHRTAQRQLMTSQIRQKELEDDIGGLMNQKKELWKRCLDLEKCLDELQDTQEESNLLRPTSAYSNLPDLVDGVLPQYSVSSEELGQREPQVHHGFMLHRCHKQINISIVGSISEDNLVSTTAQLELDVEPEKVEPEMEEDATRATSPDQGQGQSEPEVETEEGSTAQPEATETETDQTTTNIPPTQQVASDADRIQSGLSMFAKMRQRVSGLSNSIRRRTHAPILTSGSTKRPDPNAGSGGRRRR